MNDLRFKVVTGFEKELVGRCNSYVVATAIASTVHTACDIIVVDNDDNELHSFSVDMNGNLLYEYDNIGQAYDNPKPIHQVWNSKLSECSPVGVSK